MGIQCGVSSTLRFRWWVFKILLLSGLIGFHSFSALAIEPVRCDATAKGSGVAGAGCNRGIKAKPQRCLLYDGVEFTGLWRAVLTGESAAISGTKPDQINAQENSCTPLMMATGTGNLELTKSLLAAGANLEEINDDGETAVMAAIRHGQFHVLRYLINRGATWSYRTASDETPFWLSVDRADMDSAKMLLSLGADPNETGNGGISVLSKASAQGNGRMVELLLAKGARANGGGDESRWGPLAVALGLGNVQSARQLIKAGADPTRSQGVAPDWFFAVQSPSPNALPLMLEQGVAINARAQRNDETALIGAAIFGRYEALKMLIKAGAAVNAQDAGGISALMYAARNTRVDIASELLQAGAKVDLADKYGVTPFMFAAVHERYAMMKFLKSNGADVNHARADGMTALLDAAQAGNLRLVRFLLDMGADPKHLTNRGNGFIKTAAQGGNPAIFALGKQLGLPESQASIGGAQAIHQAAGDGNLSVLRALLAAEPNLIDARGGKGSSPLWMAVLGGHQEAIEYLAQSGSDVNLSDSQQVTPLMLAARKGSNRTVQTLLTAGARTDLFDQAGNGVLHHALMESDTPSIIEQLIRAGAKIDQPANNGATPLVYSALKSRPLSMKKLLDLGANINAKDQVGNTSLRNALLTSCVACAKQLIEHKADIHESNRNGSSPLQAAAGSGQVDAVRWLIDAGARVNQRDNKGETALMNAAALGHEAIIDLLIAQGADVRLRNLNGRSSLEIAAWNGKITSVQRLLAAGAEIQGTDNLGNSALHRAAENGQTEVVRLLLAAGSDTRKANHKGQTPLALAAQHREIAALLAGALK